MDISLNAGTKNAHATPPQNSGVFKNSSTLQSPGAMHGTSDNGIADRLVVEINAIPFSQYEIESFILISRALLKLPVMNSQDQANNWAATIDSFINDTLNLQVAQRRGSLQISDKELTEYLETIRALRQGNGIFSTEINRLTINEKQLANQILSFLKIRYYKRSKSPDDTVSTSENLASQPWFLEIKNNALIHFYEGAQKHLAISPKRL